MKKFIPLVLLSLLLSCGEESIWVVNNNTIVKPAGFPELVFPEDNAFTEARWALGKKLFFDPILSRDNSISCASCHHPERAFTEDRKFSLGIESRAGSRNAPTLANIGYHPYLMREGGVPTLEMQVLVPIQEHAEFDFNILLIADRLKEDSTYVQASWEAYGREPDAFVISRAISCFERTIISGNSRYDQYFNKEIARLSDAEMRGKELFFSERFSCSACHSGFNFTNYSFENNGLYEVYEDQGRFRLTGEARDVARFKVPTLRNIAVTSPYMHDGSVATLEEVVEHYNTGGKNHEHKHPLIKPLYMTTSEKTDLVAFLKTLTDYEFLSDPKFHK
jgi:cytochrome c peroxidase